MSELEHAIYKTIAYFDIFDYPLTEWELYIWIYSTQGAKITLQLVRKTLKTSDTLQKKFGHKNGMVFLSQRESIVYTRQARYVSSHRKYKIVSRFVRFARHLPFVLQIASCNNLAFFNAKEESDLDFFIVTKKGMMPIVRILMVLISILFFRRPNVAYHKDTICLSFLIDSSQQQRRSQTH